MSRMFTLPRLLIFALVFLMGAQAISTVIHAQDETPVPTVEPIPTDDPAVTPEPEPTPDTPAPDPAAVTEAGINFAAAIIGAFLTGGLTFGGVVYWVKREPGRIRQLEIIGDSIPARIAEPIVQLATTGFTILGKVTEGLQLVIEALDRVPHATKTPPTDAQAVEDPQPPTKIVG